MTKLERLQRRYAKLQQEILAEKARIFPERISKLLAAYEAIPDYHSKKRVRFLKSVVNTPDNLDTFYSVDDVIKFCQENSIPIEYDVNNDGYSSTTYSNFRLREFRMYD